MRRSPQFLAALLLLLSLLLTLPAHAATPAQIPGFPKTLGLGQIKFSSVTLADLNLDGKQEILVGSENGILYVLNSDGSLRWQFDVSAAINQAARSAGFAETGRSVNIRSAPAAANITGDSRLEVVVAAGDVTSALSHGGVVALSPDGQLLSGWPQLTQDFDDVGNNRITEGVASSPAIGDINGDGVPEIVYGSFDQHIYAKTPDGRNVPGWPQWVLDSVWSSAALADLTGDGINEVIIGVDAHLYVGQPRQTLDGGYLYAFRGNGSILWYVHQDEVFESSPAVADVTGDGRPEIFTGTGTYYSRILNRTNAQGQPVGQYFTAWRSDGTVLWRTPLPTQVVGSPAIGDITGDDKLEVVVGGLDGKLYAFDARTGAIRWSTLGRDSWNNQFNPDPRLYSPVLADYTGNGRDDVFVALGWDVIVMRGTDGQLLTNTDPTQALFYADFTVDGTPAIGDLDGDGRLELVSASGVNGQNLARVNAWKLTNSTTQASWPMHRRNASNTGTFIVPRLNALSSLLFLVEPNVARTTQLSIRANDGRAIRWNATIDDPNSIIESATTSGSASTPLELTIRKGALGSYNATLTITAEGLPSTNLQVSVQVVDELYQVNLPFVLR
jgi:outer membrane protein assembly factor BamB